MSKKLHTLTLKFGSEAQMLEVQRVLERGDEVVLFKRGQTLVVSYIDPDAVTAELVEVPGKAHMLPPDVLPGQMGLPGVREMLQ